MGIMKERDEFILPWRLGKELPWNTVALELTPKERLIYHTARDLKAEGIDLSTLDGQRILDHEVREISRNWLNS